jgi:hypothetical protein
MSPRFIGAGAGSLSGGLKGRTGLVDDQPISMAADPLPDVRQRLDELFAAATITAAPELFASYGVDLRQRDGDAQRRTSFQICSVIGFSGPLVHGALVLALTDGLPEATNPLREGQNLRDWVGELSNQLLGRVKLGLLPAGIEFFLNLPAVLRGEHLAPLPRPGVQPLTFECSQGMICIWIDLEARDGTGSGGSAEHGGVKSGDAILFE